jgi:hypothetical protein
MSAGLNDTNADAMAVAICTALGIADTASQNIAKTHWRAIYARLKVDIQVTIAASSIGTTGGPAAQSGPAADIHINPD